MKLRSGKGKYTYSNGDVYSGEFKDNLKHGIGRIIYSDKS
jgi:radial spoke head protein 1